MGKIMNNQYSLKNFLPLIIIFSIILLFTLARQWYFGFNFMNFMIDFMAGFFIVFGAFKVINLSDFAMAYQEYDLIAKKSKIYAYAYPFIELALGLCYLFRFQMQIANWITLILMIIGSIGVARELAKKREITCACLGTVFKIPMTYVTLAEDLIMGLMALMMLIY
jgi:methylamine utilization protein MauE